MTQKYVPLKTAIEMTGLTEHVLTELGEQELLLIKIKSSGRREFRSKHLRRIVDAIKGTNANTVKQVSTALDSYVPQAKVDLLFLRESDKDLAKIAVQEQEILNHCKELGLKPNFGYRIEELGSENKDFRPSLEKMLREIESGKVRRVFCWDRKRPFRGSAIQFLETHCKLHNVVLVVVKDLTGEYTEKYKRKLDQQHEMERSMNQYCLSENGKRVAREKSKRRQAMGRVYAD